MRSIAPLIVAAGFVAFFGGTTLPTVSADSDVVVDFARDVEPILRRNCYRCHGSKNQEGGLQLNLRRSAMGKADSDEPIVVSGQSDLSLLIKRVVDDEYGEVMPPDGDSLAESEIATLRRWIDQGAAWPDRLAHPKHWAYQPIKRPEVPTVAAGRSSGHSVIDRFIDARLSEQQLRPTERLDRARLIRRVSLALTGLPPTPAEVQRFLRDDDSRAYERVVDRLLGSPRFGERWAVPWLDMARYADSNGFQADQIRDNWAYRDWVIRAFNDDLPYDQFVIDQLAGDLHADATLDQRIATGFHRMTTCNVEAGVHPEANRVDQVVDRVNTTAAAFLGTTLECAQCHDHKYDPFTQEDYYRLFAYFNNTPLEVENIGGVTWEFFGPTMDLPIDQALADRIRAIDAEVAQMRKRRNSLMVSTRDEFDAWVEQLRQSGEPTWRTVVPESFESSAGEQYQILEDGAVLLTGSVPDTVEHIFTLPAGLGPVTAIKVDVLTDDAIPGKGPGRGDAERTNIILSEVICQWVTDKQTVSLELEDAEADHSQTNWDVSRAIDGDRKTGWAIAPQFGKPHWASFRLRKPADLSDSQGRLRITLAQYFGRGRVIGKPRISIFQGDTTFLNLDPQLRTLANKKSRSKADERKLRAEFDKNNPTLRRIDRQIARLEKEREQLKPETTLVMLEMDEPRETHVMIRGDYENLGPRVTPGSPKSLPRDETLPATGDRLELARWLTSSENPLLSRVTVNRWWGELFGRHLVNTPEDFGTQGETPSHPQLLDWLASELIESGWSMKHVLKLMVMSEAFRRSPHVTPELMQRDPDNRFWGRGPRFRMSAELLRDNALAISGLLSDQMYGPPIMPYQPENIWRSVGRNQPKWMAAENANRFRRGAYVVWKRAAPYPSFVNFDAPNRGSCTVRRSRSNTPLQALTLLNDPAYAEMALAMADRILSESAGDQDAERLRFAVTLALSREPSSYELSLLQELLDRERDALQKDPAMVAERTRLPFKGMGLRSSDRLELAAWFAIANTLLNLDETMTQ